MKISKLIASAEKTLAVDTQISFIVSINIPRDTEDGGYVFFIIAKYDTGKSGLWQGAFWVGYSFLLNASAARVSMTTETAITMARSRATGNSGPRGGEESRRSTCLKASMP